VIIDAVGDGVADAAGDALGICDATGDAVGSGEAVGSGGPLHATTAIAALKTTR
jgi:hypothetical protein